MGAFPAFTNSSSLPSRERHCSPRVASVFFFIAIAIAIASYVPTLVSIVSLFGRMGAAFSTLGGTFFVAVLLVGIYVGYRAVLPRRLPNIPYNRDAAGKLFGDIPEMMGYVMRTKRIFVSRRVCLCRSLSLNG